MGQLISGQGRGDNGPFDGGLLAATALAYGGTMFAFAPDPNQPKSELYADLVEAAQALTPGQVLLVENIRFEAGEEARFLAASGKVRIRKRVARGACLRRVGWRELSGRSLRPREWC